MDRFKWTRILLSLSGLVLPSTKSLMCVVIARASLALLLTGVGMFHPMLMAVVVRSYDDILPSDTFEFSALIYRTQHPKSSYERCVRGRVLGDECQDNGFDGKNWVKDMFACACSRSTLSTGSGVDALKYFLRCLASLDYLQCTVQSTCIKSTGASH